MTNKRTMPLWELQANIDTQNNDLMVSLFIRSPTQSISIDINLIQRRLLKKSTFTLLLYNNFFQIVLTGVKHFTTSEHLGKNQTE